MKNSIFFSVFSSLFLAATIAQSANAIVVKDLNFRVGPSIQYKLRGLIPAGRSVFVQNCRDGWCSVRYNAQTGWVSARYLSFKNSGDLYTTHTK